MSEMGGPILVRHAATAWSGYRYCGRSDPPLSSAGRAAAARLAADLARIVGPHARIVSSPSGRARETADSIGIASGIAAIELDARWSEADFGIAEGLTFDSLARLDPELANRLSRGESRIDWPAGETANALAARVAAAWRDVIADGRPTVVVTHAGPLRIALGLATGRPTDAIDLPAPGEVVRIGEVAAT